MRVDLEFHWESGRPKRVESYLGTFPCLGEDADGLSEIAAGLVGQGLTILESVKKSLSGSAGAEVKLFDDGAAPGQHALPESADGQAR